MSAQQIKAPKIIRLFVIEFDDEESIDLTPEQYAQLAAHFASVMCPGCKSHFDVEKWKFENL